MGSAFKSLQNIFFWYFLWREWTISKGLIIQKHGSDPLRMGNFTSHEQSHWHDKNIYSSSFFI